MIYEVWGTPPEEPWEDYKLNIYSTKTAALKRCHELANNGWNNIRINCYWEEPRLEEYFIKEIIDFSNNL